MANHLKRSGDRPATHGRRGRRTWGQRLVIGVNVVVVVGLLSVAGALAYVHGKYSRLPRLSLSSALARPAVDAPARNFLLVGADRADALDPDDPVRSGRDSLGIGGQRSDTIMVVRVDPDEERASLLSIPRDLWLPIATGGTLRINSALQLGGARALIDTVEGSLGIPVHHYVQVDFAGFHDLVEAMGGVTVPFPYPARDHKSELDIPEAGCITLDGGQALAYVRSRQYTEQVDGRWRTDPTADHGRMRRQQDFVRRALDQALDRVLRSPGSFDDLLDAALDAVVVDDLLRASDLIELASTFRTFDADDLDLHTLPVAGAVVGNASVVRLREAEAEGVLDVFRGIERPATTTTAPGGTSTTSTSSTTSTTTRSTGAPADVAC